MSNSSIETGPESQVSSFTDALIEGYTLPGTGYTEESIIRDLDSRIGRREISENEAYSIAQQLGISI